MTRFRSSRPKGPQVPKRKLTDAEKARQKAARESRERQFAQLCNRIGGIPEPVREHRFDVQQGEAKARQWQFDFAWPRQKVAVEIEGGTHGGGQSRHTNPEGYRKDCEKYNRAAVLGWCVLRYTSVDLDRQPVQIIEQIREALAASASRFSFRVIQGSP